jgi:adenylate kinase
MKKNLCTMLEIFRRISSLNLIPKRRKRDKKKARKHDPDQRLDYAQARMQSEISPSVRRLRKLEVVVVGLGGVGKTTLITRVSVNEQPRQLYNE